MKNDVRGKGKGQPFPELGTWEKSFKVQGKHAGVTGVAHSFLLHKNNWQRYCWWTQLALPKGCIEHQLWYQLRTNCFRRLSKSFVCDQVSLKTSAVPKGYMAFRHIRKDWPRGHFQVKSGPLWQWLHGSLDVKVVRHAQGISKDVKSKHSKSAHLDVSNRKANGQSLLFVTVTGKLL